MQASFNRTRSGDADETDGRNPAAIGRERQTPARTIRHPIWRLDFTITGSVRSTWAWLNSRDIYNLATVLKQVLGSLRSVHALLTGRVLRTASGGSELS